MKTHYYSWQLSAAEIAQHGPLLLERMRKRWPAAFDKPKPLKLGIRQDLIAARVSAQDADLFLTWYTRTGEYLRAQAEPGGQRIDLLGKPCGTVTPDNAAFAAQLLEEQKYAAFRTKLIGDGRG